MVLLTADERLAQLEPDAGASVVYVEFIESAPWNIATPARRPAYRGVGLGLMRAAVRSSRQRGHGGRLGLHMLPQSVGFYAARCGMTSIGADPGYADMEYLEHTVASADRFLAGEN